MPTFLPLRSLRLLRPGLADDHVVAARIVGQHDGQHLRRCRQPVGPFDPACRVEPQLAAQPVTQPGHGHRCRAGGTGLLRPGTRCDGRGTRQATVLPAPGARTARARWPHRRPGRPAAAVPSRDRRTAASRTRAPPSQARPVRPSTEGQETRNRAAAGRRPGRTAGTAPGRAGTRVPPPERAAIRARPATGIPRRPARPGFCARPGPGFCARRGTGIPFCARPGGPGLRARPGDRGSALAGNRDSVLRPPRGPGSVLRSPGFRRVPVRVAARPLAAGGVTRLATLTGSRQLDRRQSRICRIGPGHDRVRFEGDWPVCPAAAD